jgi:hypothetical protein
MMIQCNEFGATKALQVFESSPSRLTNNHTKRTASPMINSITTNTNTSSMKRSRPSSSSSSSSSSFDMRDFIKASQQVEETIAFPTIEWPSLDYDDDDDSSSSCDDSDFSFSRTTKNDNDDDEDDDFFQQQPIRKRQCRGLSRCDRSCNLSSLYEMAITSERRGSNGSLS